MDLLKYRQAFENMDYDDKTAVKVTLPNTKSTIIVTESADIEGATDFISRCFQSDDLNQIRSILVQASVEDKFLEILQSKLKPTNFQYSDLLTLKPQFESFAARGLQMIQSLDNGSFIPSTIIKCPRNLIAGDLPIVNLEVFRTTKEAISFAKCSLSIGLWCENISIAFEYINELKNARQIWLNSAHGTIHPKIPFYNGKVVCEDAEVASNACADLAGCMFQVAGNVQFSTNHKFNTFQTVVIPFGETFAN